jgi:hypothetical protein
MNNDVFLAAPTAFSVFATAKTYFQYHGTSGSWETAGWLCFGTGLPALCRQDVS